MTDLTDDQVRALLDGARQPLDDLSRNPSRKGQHDLMNAAPDLARALLQARAELAAANAREAGLQNLPPDYGHDGVRWKIGTAMCRSIDAASPLTDRDAALYHAFRAGLRAALASSPAQNEGDAT